MLRHLIFITALSLSTSLWANSMACKDLPERTERLKCQYQLLKGTEYARCNGLTYTGIVLTIERPKKDVEDITVKEFYFFSNINMLGVLTFEYDKEGNGTFISSRMGVHAYFSNIIRLTNANGEYESYIDDFDYSSLDILGNPTANIFVTYMHPTFDETEGEFETAKIERFPYSLRQIRSIAGDQFQENICR